MKYVLVTLIINRIIQEEKGKKYVKINKFQALKTKNQKNEIS